MGSIKMKGKDGHFDRVCFNKFPAYFLHSIGLKGLSGGGALSLAPIKMTPFQIKLIHP
jgi:hypothetical protein